MTDHSHLNALQVRLSNERVRLELARTEEEKELRKVWVSGIEKEIKAERAFLGLPEEEELPKMTLDEILAELDLDPDTPEETPGPKM